MPGRKQLIGSRLYSDIPLMSALPGIAGDPPVRFEDFVADYTESDAAARLGLAQFVITISDLDMDEVASVSKDFGAGFFDALDVEGEFKYVGSSHGTTNPAYFFVGGFLASPATGIGSLASTDLIVRATITNTPTYHLVLIRGNQVAVDTSANLSTDTLYYWTLSREAGSNDATFYIYSDAAKTTLVDTLTLSGYSTATWRYLYALLGSNNSISGRAIDAVLQNILLN